MSAQEDIPAEIEDTHDPVLLPEILENVPLNQAKVVIDCTTGLGGHLSALAQKTSPTCKLLALDQDEKHLAIAKTRLGPLADKCVFIHKNFVHLLECARMADGVPADIILYDLGLASPHVDRAERGFSYKKDGPLDMRFDQSAHIPTAKDLVNTLSEKELADIFFHYGEERRSRPVARKICDHRHQAPIESTQDMREIIESLSPIPKERNQMLKRVFQALRIAVNDELEVLKQSLIDAISILAPGGRIAVISYHSLEDRIVKQTFKSVDNTCHCPIEIPICECEDRQLLKIITRKPILPSPQEIEDNPRSRSAKLRIAEKL